MPATDGTCRGIRKTVSINYARLFKFKFSSYVKTRIEDRYLSFIISVRRGELLLAVRYEKDNRLASPSRAPTRVDAGESVYSTRYIAVRSRRNWDNPGPHAYVRGEQGAGA